MTILNRVFICLGALTLLVGLRKLVLRRQAPSIIYSSQPKSFFLGDIEPNPEEIVKACFAFGVDIVALPMYSGSIFPLIPQIAGGGKLQMVSIVIKPERAAVIRAFEGLQSDLRMGSTLPGELLPKKPA